MKLIHVLALSSSRTFGAEPPDTCRFADGSGNCCYRVDVRFDKESNHRYGAPGYEESVLDGDGAKLPSASHVHRQPQPVAHSYSLSSPYVPPTWDNWGWGSDSAGGPLLNYVEQQQFVLHRRAAKMAWFDGLKLTVGSQTNCSRNMYPTASAFRALWQTGSSNVNAAVHPWKDDMTVEIDYKRYIEEGVGRSFGDPIHVTLVPCANEGCTDFDPTRVVAVTVSFKGHYRSHPIPGPPGPVSSEERPVTDERLDLCEGNHDGGNHRGHDCCYVSKSIAPEATQVDIDHAVKLTSHGHNNSVPTSCLKRPYWQCYDADGEATGDTTNVTHLRYKGSLVDFVEDQRRFGRATRIVLADRSTLNLPLTTTYVEYTVDPSAAGSCNVVCSTGKGQPSISNIKAVGGDCKLSAVSSFAAVNEGKVSVAGFGRIDGLSHMSDTTYFTDAVGASPHNADKTPGHACNTCNRFCPLTPYAWGMHALTPGCNDVFGAYTSNLKAEEGDVRYHMDSAMLELSSNAKHAQWAVDISDVTVSNSLKRGDSSVMVQSGGHFVFGDNCKKGTLEEQQSTTPCQGPNLPARTFGLKYMGSWHDAVDGPSIKSERSEHAYLYTQTADDNLKPYGHSTIRDSTVIQGGVGGAITPCTYNLQSYTPGCSGVKVLRTHIVRVLDGKSGYESPFGRGGLLASRYCSGKTNLGWTHFTEGVFKDNVIDGVVVEALASRNQVGRAVSLVVDEPQGSENQVYFCHKIQEPLPLVFASDAFVFKNWHVQPPVNNADSDGSGGILFSARYTKANLTVVKEGAIDVRGIHLGMSDDGMGCNFTGSYFPCPVGSASSIAASCFFAPDDGEPVPFKSGGGPCASWSAPQSAHCEAPAGSDGFDCHLKFRLDTNLYGTVYV